MKVDTVEDEMVRMIVLISGNDSSFVLVDLPVISKSTSKLRRRLKIQQMTNLHQLGTHTAPLFLNSMHIRVDLQHWLFLISREFRAM